MPQCGTELFAYLAGSDVIVATIKWEGGGLAEMLLPKLLFLPGATVAG